MKKIIILLLVFSSEKTLFSQTTKTGSKVTTAVNANLAVQAEPVDISNQLYLAKKKEGNQLVTTSGGIKLFATINKGSVAKMSATDGSGKELQVAFSSVTAKNVIKCRACVSDSHGTVCWWINCKDLPRPSGASSTR